MWAAIIAAVATIVTTLISQNQQETSNQRAAQWQLDAQKSLIDQQNQYNLPTSQMQRFRDAGLNPHLIYGQGSPGLQTTPGAAPSMQAVDRLMAGGTIGKSLTDLVPLYNQTRLVNAQVDAQNASTVQKYAATRVSELQAQVLEKNPLLNDAGWKATIDGLVAAASLKQSQSKMTATQADIQDKASGHIVNKIFKEVELLEQKFKLAELDEKIKAEVLKSKEFQNAILEVQKKFMTDAEVTPQHMLQFVQLLLMKAL